MSVGILASLLLAERFLLKALVEAQMGYFKILSRAPYVSLIR